MRGLVPHHLVGCNEVAHVNPVVVNRDWRGYGVGRALMDDALARYGELRFVARGGAVAFYRALGYEEISWDDVDTGHRGVRRLPHDRGATPFPWGRGSKAGSPPVLPSRGRRLREAVGDAMRSAVGWATACGTGEELSCMGETGNGMSTPTACRRPR